MARLRQLTILVAMVLGFVVEAEKVMNSRKQLDDQTTPYLDNKCGDCPCDSPCNPPPTPPPPPPPTNSCPPPPPKAHKPPNPPYIYVNGPPGSVYPIYPYYSGDGRSFSIGTIPFLIACILWPLVF